MLFRNYICNCLATVILLLILNHFAGGILYWWCQLAMGDHHLEKKGVKSQDIAIIF